MELRRGADRRRDHQDGEGERRWWGRALAPTTLAVFVAAAGSAYFASAPASASQPPPVSASSTTPPGGQSASSSATVSSGRAIFVATCSTCHGVTAEGSAYAPNLVGLGAATIDFWISTGRMPLAYPSSQPPEKPPVLTAAERKAVVAYVTSLGSGGPGIPKVQTKGANLAAGANIFSLNCAGCHTIAGTGDALTAGYYAPSLMPATATQVAEAMRTGPGNMPRFGPHQLSARQVDEVAAYVTKVLQHPYDHGGFGLGHVGPVTEGFVAFLFGVGSLLVAAYWIGELADKRHSRQGSER